MTTITANYKRDDLTTVALIAYVAQDTGDGCDSDLLVVWADETLPVIAALDAEEQVGAIEAIEQAFFDDEHADAARVRSAQQRGDQAFFDARNAARKIEAA